ncbi:hypothetical protein ACFY3U_11995 [Micromonospora sp. NPDC000089]|uniref:hypothetical protein n=1 Tax=unclassified Micromonospora TaxID=2617518 RepID=UPI0036C21435
MRPPLQGGLPPTGTVVGPVVEIACDESGFSGTNLLDPATPVIAHASVDLSVDEAAELVTALRSRLRCSPEEVKSGQFRRGPEADRVRGWFLDSLRGRAHVELLDKELFLVSRIVDLFLAEPSYAAGARRTDGQRPAARALLGAGRPVGADWAGFLTAFVDLVRTRRRHRPDRDALERFFRSRDGLLRHGLGAGDDILRGLRRDRVWAVPNLLFDDDPTIPPPLEPLLPALADTVLFWSGGWRGVLVVHDEQSALTAGRLRRLQRALADDRAAPDQVLVGLVMADSRDDPRVQVADLLAGTSRRASADDLLATNRPPAARHTADHPVRTEGCHPSAGRIGVP